MKKKSYPVVNIGIVPVFTIFIILCMVTFAVLSYMSADRDYTFSSQVAEHTTDYYRAASDANQQIAFINQTLSDSLELGVYEKTELFYAFSIPVSDTEELVVKLERLTPEEARALKASDAEDAAFTRITMFEKISTKEWQGDDSLNLLK